MNLAKRLPVLFLLLFVGTVSCGAADRPNVLFVAIVDLRPALGCDGSEIAISPGFDGLAAEELLFERAYCQEGKTRDRERFEQHLMGYTMRTDRDRLVVRKDMRSPEAGPIDVELFDQQIVPRETLNIAASRRELVRVLLEQFDAGWATALSSRTAIDNNN